MPPFCSNCQFQKSEEEIKYFSVKTIFIKNLVTETDHPKKKCLSVSKEKILEKVSPMKKRNDYVLSNTLILDELISEGKISHVTENWNKQCHVLLCFMARSSRRVSHPAGNNCS